MPGSAQHTEINAEYAERFAALWAGSDTGNVNDAEACGKWRAIRRMAQSVNLRVIDLIGRRDVMRALDVQLAPACEEAPELAEAQEKAAAYCREAKEAMAQVTHYAGLVQAQDETIKELRRKLAASSGASSHAGLVSGGLVAFVALLALALMIVGGMSLGQ